MLSLLAELAKHQIISQLDYYFAKLIADKQQAYPYSPVQQNVAILTGALCSYSYQQGHTCLFLDEQNQQNLFGLAYRQMERDYLDLIAQKIDFLPMAQWQACLSEHIAFSADPAKQVAPLVFQFGHVYFYRVWQEEKKLVDYLKRAVQISQNFSPNTALINAILHQLFDCADNEADRQEARQQQGGREVDWQKIAVATALKQSFCLITGGPGTGKTTTVFRLLAALQLQRLQQQQPPLRIKLVAPTGKAATRLTESLQQALDRALVRLPQLADLLQLQASTLHRLLRVQPLDDRCYFNEQNPLAVDVLVVDEASMLDLAMMNKLLSALQTGTKLILLGDKDQLSSVEAGAILGELGQYLYQVEQKGYSPKLTEYLAQTTGYAPTDLLTHNKANPLCDHLCSLRKSYRFNRHSGIGQLAQAINQEGFAPLSLFEQYQDIEFHLLQGSEQANLQRIVTKAVQCYQPYLHYIHQLDPAAVTPAQLSQIFRLFKASRFLTALRIGEYGVENLNYQIALKLKQQAIVQFRYPRDWYLGKPIMIMENDSQAGLYNGDIGIALVDQLGRGKVWFEIGENQFKAVITSRIPKHESAFMMTVHKSQGSEFDHTLLVLPSKFSPLLSKELVYTAVTRAKKQFSVFSSETIWKTAIKNKVKRQSGLGQWLNGLSEKNSR